MTAENTTISLYGYSNDPIYEKLIDKLGYLAGLWRRHKTTEIADQYQTVLRTLILLGYDDELPVDAELPQELMPAEYISLFTD